MKFLWLGLLKCVLRCVPDNDILRPEAPLPLGAMKLWCDPAGESRLVRLRILPAVVRGTCTRHHRQAGRSSLAGLQVPCDVDRQVH